MWVFESWLHANSEFLSVCAHPVPIDALADVRLSLIQLDTHLNIKGIILLATKGLNGNLCGTRQGIEQMLARLQTVPLPDYRLKVCLKREIISLGLATMIPPALKSRHVDLDE